MSYNAVLFDNDGVLTVPTEFDVLTSSVEATFREFDVEAPPDPHVRSMFHARVEGVRDVCAEYGIDHGEFWERRDRNASAAQQTEIRAGRKTLYDDFEALETLGADLGIVSNNQHETIEYIVDFFDIGHLFETVYGREPTVEGIRRKKPNTYYLERALADLDVTDALYVGDSNVDVAAARSLGIDSAFVHRPHRDGYELEYEPTHEIDGLDEIRELVDVA